MQIASRFVQWAVPSLETLKDSKVYQFRERLNQGGKLDRKENNWLTEAMNQNTYFKRAVPLQGWKFDFSDVCHLYWVKSRYGQISEYYALDKTSLRSILSGSDNHIVELI